MVLVQVFATPIVLWIGGISLAISKPQLLSIILLAVIPLTCFIVYLFKKWLRLIPLLVSIIIMGSIFIGIH